MAFCGPRTALMREGDVVIVFQSMSTIESIKLQRGHTFQNEFGLFNHNDFIGQHYGAWVQASGRVNTGFVGALFPSSVLWTRALQHRTQILYKSDIALIVARLNLKPGKVVLESGTGSGSLSTAIAQTIYPKGHLHTFEFNEERVRRAKLDFARNGLDRVITVNHHDVCGKGFPTVPGGVDAVFLDLPSPWGVVLQSAHRELKAAGTFCSFSPCIEQVQRTSAELTKVGFVEVETLECVLRSFSPRLVTLDTLEKPKGTKPPSLEMLSHVSLLAANDSLGHSGYLTFAMKPAVFRD